MKKIGSFYWEMQPGYPELSSSDGVSSITVKVVTDGNGLSENLPDYGALFSSEDPFFARYGYLKLSARTVKLLHPDMYEVTLTYDREMASYDAADAEVMEEIEYVPSDENIPIGQHPGYFTWWDHSLCVKESGTLTLPAWAKSVKDTSLSFLAFDIQQNYRWVKAGEQIPDGFIEILGAKKPQVSFFLDGHHEVVRTLRCSNLRKLVRQATADYHIQTPPETFGLVGEWLRKGSPIRRNGRYWEQVITYLFSKEIDKEIYSEA